MQNWCSVINGYKLNAVLDVYICAMKTRVLHIDIPLLDVFSRIRVKASYLAGKSIPVKGASAYDQIEIADADIVLLKRYIRESASSVLRSLLPYVGMSHVGVRFECDLRMPLNFDDGKCSEIEELLTEYMVNESLGKWYSVTSKEDAEHHYDIAAGVLVTLNEVLSSRLRPMRMQKCAVCNVSVEFEEGGEQ